MARRDLLPIILLPVCALAASLALMTHAPWPQHWDATGYAIRSIELVRALDGGLGEHLRRFPGSHGPVLPLLNTAAMVLAPGVNPFWPMAWVQILACVTAVAAGYAALRQYASLATATIALVIYLVEPMQLKWATEVMHEGPGLALIALWLLAIAIDTRVTRPATFCAAALATGLVTLSRLNFGIPALAGFGLYALVRLWRAPAVDRKRLILLGLTPLVLTTVVWQVGTGFYQFRYYLSFAEMDSSLQLYWQGTSHSWLGMQLEFLRHVVQYWGSPVVVLVLIASVLAIVDLARRFPGRFTAPSIFLLTLVALLIVSKGRHERYVAPTLLPALGLIAWAAHDEWWRPGVRRALRVLLVAALIGQGLLWLERAHVSLPAPMRLALRADSGPPFELKGGSDLSRRLIERIQGLAPAPDARVLFLGNSYDVNWGYMYYWTLVTRTPLRWSSAWEPLDPPAITRTFEKRLGASQFFLFAPATDQDGRHYREGSRFAQSVVERWTHEGRIRAVFEEPRYHVTVYQVTPVTPGAAVQ
jgi:hypothetical protein